jgi:hypothetical protein
MDTHYSNAQGDLQGQTFLVGVMNEEGISTWRWFSTFTTAEDILGTAQKCSWNIKTFRMM